LKRTTLEHSACAGKGTLGNWGSGCAGKAKGEENGNSDSSTEGPIIVGSAKIIEIGFYNGL